MNIFQLARCAFGRHERDRSTVTIGARWHHGHCKGCGASMVKDARGWRIERDPIA